MISEQGGCDTVLTRWLETFDGLRRTDVEGPSRHLDAWEGWATGWGSHGFDRDAWAGAATGWGSHGFEPSAKSRGQDTYKGKGKDGGKGGAKGKREWKGTGFEPSDKGKGSFKGKGKYTDTGKRWDKS